IGWIVRDRAARQAKVADNLQLALERAELCQEQGRLAEAVATCERAELLAGEAAAEPALWERMAELKRRLDADTKDREVVARVEEIRLLEQSQVIETANRFARERGFPKIQEAFRHYGIELGVSPASEVAARIQTRPQAIQTHMLAALDECYDIAD